MGAEPEGDGGETAQQDAPGPAIDQLPTDPPPPRLKSLYNASELAERPVRMPVLLTETEASAQVAKNLFGKTYICLAYQAYAAKHRARGGPMAPHRYYDFAPLNNRDIVIWPNADAEGTTLAAVLGQVLFGSAAKVRFVVPDRADGWDIARAAREGWDGNQILAYAKEHIRVAEAPLRIKTIDDKRLKAEVVEQPDPASQSNLVTWQDLGLAADGKQVPYATLSNASMILQLHEAFKGRIWLDSFRGKVYHTLDGGVPGQWTDAHTRRVTAWIQQSMQLPKFSGVMVQEAVLHAAEQQQRHSLRDWLETLAWDGISRLDTWLADTLGLERNPYNDAVARNWPIGMIARAMKPGCKMDNMPVLEGRTGLQKTTFLEVLGSPWYKSLPMAFGDKDFLQAIQGAWLVEIPDMTGFSRREHSHILATITIRTDTYRASYGRFVEEHPRVAVFAATSETDEYLIDTRGKRRYWPLRCECIDIDTLRAQREQIFAEAMVQYNKGASWYKMPETAETEQLARATHDLWAERVLDEAEALWSASYSRITSTLLLQKIGVELPRQDDGSKARIARIMRANGWTQKRSSGSRQWKKIERVTFDDAKEPVNGG